MKTNRLLAVGVIALALAAAAVAAFLGLASARRDAAPEVAYTLIDGRQGTLQALRGKVVLVSFWSMNCDTCVNEMPSIVATDGKFRSQGYETLAVAMSYDPPVFVSGFAESRKLPFGVAIDNTGAIARSFGNVQLTPTSFLIDKHGRVVKRYVGAPDFAALDELVEQLLAET